MSRPTLALVGRPNVGKSQLFNRLTGTRRALVHDMSGVTRDRLYGELEWEGRPLRVVDTGGLVPDASGSIEEHITDQVELALDEASVVLFVVDGGDGITGLDEDIASKLRKRGGDVPLILLVNKTDSVTHEARIGEFARFGFPHVHMVSGLHDRGLDSMLDQVLELLPPPGEDEEDDADRPLRVAFVGKPNAGKSSLVNRLVEDDRLIVSPEAGTTREAIEVPFRPEAEDERAMVLVDTAGLRRRGRARHGVEGLMRLSSEKAIRLADIVVFMLDAEEPLSHQDKTIAGLVQDSKKPTILVLNKIDLLEDLDSRLEVWESELDHQMSWYAYAPRVAVSAETGENLDALLRCLRELAARFDFRFATPRLNRMVREAMIVHPPRARGGRALKIRYAVQKPGKPGSFVFKVNDPDLLHFSFRRYLENVLRQEGDFEGIPLTLHFQKRGLGKKAEEEMGSDLVAIEPRHRPAEEEAGGDGPGSKKDRDRAKPARGGNRRVRRVPARKKGGGAIQKPARPGATKKKAPKKKGTRRSKRTPR